MSISIFGDWPKFSVLSIMIFIVYKFDSVIRSISAAINAPAMIRRSL